MTTKINLLLIQLYQQAAYNDPTLGISEHIEMKNYQ